MFNALNTTTLRGTAAIVRQRSNINNLHHLDSCTMNGTDSRLTSVTGTFHIGLHLAQTQVISNLCAILGCHLSSIRSVLLRTNES